MDHLPPELIGLIVDHLRDDKAALKACSVVSRAFLPRFWAHLFESFVLRTKDIEDVRAHTQLLSHRALFYIRNLYVLERYGSPMQLSHLDGIFEVFVAFKNVRDLKLALLATDFVNLDLTLTSRHFTHFQPTLRSLQLTVPTNNPKDLITFIAFFPFLEEVTLEFFRPFKQVNGKSGELDPSLLNPLRGTLRIYATRSDSGFTQELAKVRVQYHTLELFLDPVSFGTGLQALIAAYAPTLRVLRLQRSAEIEDRGPRINLAACTRLAEIRLYSGLDSFSQHIQTFSALLSTIRSPDFHLAQLSFHMVPANDLGRELGNLEEWKHLEEVLLTLSRKRKNTLQVVILLSRDVGLLPDCDGFMLRFQGVGKVRCDFA